MDFGHRPLYIDGQLTEAAAGNTFTVVDPATESPVATVAWAGRADAERALAAAERGFRTWSALPPERRLAYIKDLRREILERRDHLRRAIHHEMGKSWEGTDEDLSSITDSLEFYGEAIGDRLVAEAIPDREGTHRHRVVHQPVGVVVAFLAYNFPLLNLGFKLGPALAAGCSIVIKPSEYAPLSAYLIGECCHAVGLPAGVVNVLCGDTAEVGVPLCESTIPRLVTMIGSTATAQQLIRQSSATSLKRFSMECGGNAPFIVFPDADLGQAIAIGAALKTGNSGQICVAPNRFYVHDTVIEAFTQGLAERFAAATIAPLANRRSVDKVHDIVGRARAQGARLVHGGALPPGPGYYYPPTVLRLDDPRAPILGEEVFGPVAIVVPFTDRDEVIALANDTDSGLASYVFTRDRETMDYFAEHLDFGEVQLNGVKYAIYLPHGGIKNSGFGVDCSADALDDYLIRKRVTEALPA